MTKVRAICDDAPVEESSPMKRGLKLWKWRCVEKGRHVEESSPMKRGLKHRKPPTLRL